MSFGLCQVWQVSLMRVKLLNIIYSILNMGGGLIQLIAKGKSDVYITGNPQFSFFKSVYRRHTNFTIESIEQSVHGLSVGECNAHTKLSRSGDLITNIWIEALLDRGDAQGDNSTSYINWTDNTGHALIKECSISIGGQLIDKHDSNWLDIRSEIHDTFTKEWIGLNKHAAKNPYLKSGSITSNNEKMKVYIPLHFWFCNNPGLALPIISLKKHDVEFKMTLRSVEKLLNSDTIAPLTYTNTIPNVKVWCDYIFLDKEEKMKFLTEKRAYLIEQVQQGTYTMGNKVELKFNHPVKELFWFTQNKQVSSASPNNVSIDAASNTVGSMTQYNDYFNYKNTQQGNTENIYGVRSNESFLSMNITMNTIERFSKRDATYFRLCQPIQSKHRLPTKLIYMYSFALEPEKHQPSGTCNFSKIDDIFMNFETNIDHSNEHLKVYALNYNVLIVTSGMGGLVYKT